MSVQLIKRQQQQPQQQQRHATASGGAHNCQLLLLLLQLTLCTNSCCRAMEMPLELMNMIAALHTPTIEQHEQQQQHQQQQPLLQQQQQTGSYGPLEMLSDDGELVDLPPLLMQAAAAQNTQAAATAAALDEAEEQELKQVDDAMSKYQLGIAGAGGSSAAELLDGINDESASIDEHIAEAKWLLQQQQHPQQQQQQQQQQQHQRVINEPQGQHQQQQQQHHNKPNNIAFSKPPLKQKQRKPNVAFTGATTTTTGNGNQPAEPFELRTCHVKIQRKVRGFCQRLPLGNACIAGDFVDMSDECN